MPSLVVIAPPAATLVSLAEAKAHLRVDHDDDDARIQGLLWAAQNEFDGPDGWLGRAVGVQTLELRLPGFPCHDRHPGVRADIPLPCPPLLTGEGHPLTVKYTDPDGAEQTVDPALYTVAVSGRAGSARLALVYGAAWPQPRWQADAVRLRYDAGYAPDNPAAEGLKQAIKLHVEMNYDGADEVKLRAAIVNLLSVYRLF